MSFNADARIKLGAGITALANAVKVTLGPRGRNVIISRDNSVAITKDGVTVAREVHLEDYMEDVGAQMVKQVANKVSLEAGDGTTTATVLAHAIFIEGNKLVVAGSHPMELKKGIEAASKAIVEKLKDSSIKVQGIGMIRQVATISSNNDEQIGRIIADAMQAVGFEGIITAGESKTGETYVEIVTGMQFNNGYISPYFINTPENGTVEFEKPMVLLYDGKISNMTDVLQYLEFSNKTGRPIVIICDGVDGDALNTLLINNIKGKIKAAAVRAPGFGEQRKVRLEDMAILTKAKLITQLEGTTLKESVANEFVGYCDKVVITNESTTIIGGTGDPTAIQTRIDDLKVLIGAASSETIKIMLKERLAKFEGGVAIIKIGAVSEIEAREKADRIDDALGATRAAIAEGIISGGGIPLALAANSLNLIMETRDQQAGVEILQRACQEPFRVILENAGQKPDVVWNKIKEGNCQIENYGFDVKNEVYVDMILAGIIDPVKVTKSALENAVSIASLLLTTDCLMVQPPKPQVSPQVQ